MSVGGLLRRKLLRDLRTRAPQFFAVFVMSALCLAVYAGLEGGWRGMQVEQRRMDTAAHLADVWITASDPTPEQVDQLRAIPSVEEVEDLGVVDAAVIDSPATLTVSSLPMRINRPETVSGATDRLGADGIAVDASFAEAHSLAVGDLLPLRIAGTERTYSVAAVVRAADHVSDNGPDGLSAPDPTKYGYAYVSPQTMADLTPTRHSLVLSGATERILADAPQILGVSRLAMYDRSTLPGYVGLSDRVQQIHSLSLLFVSLFLAVAMLAMFTSMRRLVDMQQRLIATMKALGVSDRQLRRHYAHYAAVVALGTVVGAALAPALSVFVLESQRPMFGLVSWQPSFTPAPALVATALVSGAAVIAVLATRRARRTQPATAMRGGPPTARPSRATWRRSAPLNVWALREVATARGRLVTALAATVGGTTLLIAGFGMPDSLHHQIAQSFDEQYLYSAQARLEPGAWQAQGAELAAGIDQTQWQMTFLSPSEDGHADAVTVLSDGDLYRLRDNGAVVSPPEVGALVSRAFADEHGLQIGDQVSILPPADSSRVLVTVRGLVDVDEPQGIFLSRDAWEEAGGTFVPSMLLAGDPGAADILTSRSGIASLLTHDSLRTNAEDVVDGLGGVFTLIRAFGLMLTMVVLINLGALAFAERTRDYATLTVLGVRPGEIRGLLVKENLGITIAGALLGLPTGFAFLTAYLMVFRTERVVYTAAPSAATLLVCLAITIACGASASLLLARRLRRVDLLSALKFAE